jgi:hypothetical protein
MTITMTTMTTPTTGITTMAAAIPIGSLPLPTANAPLCDKLTLQDLLSCAVMGESYPLRNRTARIVTPIGQILKCPPIKRVI